jgi:hypothetical protein
VPISFDSELPRPSRSSYSRLGSISRAFEYQRRSAKDGA